MVESLSTPTIRRRLIGLGWITLVVATAIVAFAAYGSLSRKILNPDPFVFGIAANRLLAGQRLYADFFEAKPPLATLCYALPGAFWPRSYLAVCQLLAALLTLQGLLWLAWFRPRLVTAAVCLGFVVLYPASFGPFAWLSTEHMSNLFITVVLLVSVATYRDGRLVGWRWVLAGTATAAAFHCRQNAVLCVLVPLAVISMAPQPWGARLRAAAWLGVGGVAAWSVFLGVACLISDPASYFYQVFIFPQRFAQVGGRAERFCLVATMGDNSLPALLGASVGLGLIGPYRRLVLIAIPVALLMCLAPPRSHYNYWVLLFPFMTMSLLTGLLRDHPRTVHLELVALAIFGVTIGTGLLETIPVARSPSETEPMAEVAAWIDDHARENDTLYVFAPGGCEYLAFRSRLLPANKYAISWEIDANDGMMADRFEDILRGYLQRPPTVFVIHESKLVEIDRGEDPQQTLHSTHLARELLRNDRYEQVAALHGFHIYWLRDAAARRGADADKPLSRHIAALDRLDAQNGTGRQYRSCKT